MWTKGRGKVLESPHLFMPLVSLTLPPLQMVHFRESRACKNDPLGYHLCSVIPKTCMNEKCVVPSPKVASYVLLTWWNPEQQFRTCLCHDLFMTLAEQRLPWKLPRPVLSLKGMQSSQSCREAETNPETNSSQVEAGNLPPQHEGLCSTSVSAARSSRLQHPGAGSAR